MSKPVKPIVVVGSINMDLVARTERIPVAGETVLGRDFQMHPGGKGANQAVAIARLDVPVRLVGRLGNDAFGRQLRDHLQSAGVDLAGVMTTEGASGVAIIVVSQRGENSIVVTPGANALLTPQDLDDNIEIIRSASMVLTQLEIPLQTVEHLAAICARENVALMLDPAPARTLPDRLLEKITWFTPNESEAAFFSGVTSDAHADAEPAMIAKALLAQGCRNVILKPGARGAYIACADGFSATVDPYSVEAIDTTAAGDAYNGAFAASLSSAAGLVESARFASAAAAISVTRIGAQSSMATREEVARMIS